jgi:hypothetical protein
MELGRACKGAKFVLASKLRVLHATVLIDVHKTGRENGMATQQILDNLISASDNYCIVWQVKKANHPFRGQRPEHGSSSYMHMAPEI